MNSSLIYSIMLYNRGDINSKREKERLREREEKMANINQE